VHARTPRCSESHVGRAQSTTQRGEHAGKRARREASTQGSEHAGKRARREASTQGSELGGGELRGGARPSDAPRGRRRRQGPPRDSRRLPAPGTPVPTHAGTVATAESCVVRRGSGSPSRRRALTLGEASPADGVFQAPRPSSVSHAKGKSASSVPTRDSRSAFSWVSGSGATAGRPPRGVAATSARAARSGRWRPTGPAHAGVRARRRRVVHR
jgi:hypothetical protein